MTDQYAVIGNPIAHSKSPLIHSEFARQTGQQMSYVARLAPLHGFVDSVHEFIAMGGKGMNVTVPFKLEAHALATQLTQRASAAQAVNTLQFLPDGRILGDNTDGAGLVRDLTHNLNVTLTSKRILLLGAGGAAQGVILPLLGEKPATLTIANRTASKASALAELFAAERGDTKLSGSGFGELSGEAFDVVINATSSSLSQEAPPLPSGIYAQGAVAYDMMYGKGLTPFLRDAQNQGAAHLADGAGMLVEQAAESFTLWRGVRPDTELVLNQLRIPLE